VEPDLDEQHNVDRNNTPIQNQQSDDKNEELEHNQTAKNEDLSEPAKKDMSWQDDINSYEVKIPEDISNPDLIQTIVGNISLSNQIMDKYQQSNNMNTVKEIIEDLKNLTKVEVSMKRNKKKQVKTKSISVMMEE
jgi:hypothetical protein